MISIEFTKMHGLGNDFVVIEHHQLPGGVSRSELAVALCDRHFGVGADGLILVSPAQNPTCALRFEFYNNDGSQSEMCGNGIRCFAQYVVEKRLVQEMEFRVETMTGMVIPKLLNDGRVIVNMGAPILEPHRIPFVSDTQTEANQVSLQIQPDLNLPITAVSMGNPHCVIFLSSPLYNTLDFKTLGPIIEYHPQFPAKTNVEFCLVTTPHQVKVFVWERGVGPTLACGSGACAVAVAGILNGVLSTPVEVQLPGGSLNIEWLGGLEDPVLMTGPAQTVFSGVYRFQQLPDLARVLS